MPFNCFDTFRAIIFIFFSMRMDQFVKWGLLLTLFCHHLVVVSCTTTIVENTYLGDFSEFTILGGRTVESQIFESDPLGLNFEPERPEDKTQSFNVSEEWLPEPPVFQWTKKPTEIRREAEPLPKMLTTSYENNFDRRYGLRYNYAEIFEESKNTLVKPTRRFYSANYSFASFPGLNEVYEYLTVLEKLSDGRAVVIPLQQHNGSWSNVHTNFGNEILSIRISSKPGPSHERNPIMVVVAGIHGGDWYAVQSAIFVSAELILNANRVEQRDLDWWIIPVFNPDGYEISHTGSEWRDWRKNLHGSMATNGSKCFGVDLDSNFEYQWLACSLFIQSFIIESTAELLLHSPTGNHSSCDSNFPGDPFTEPESRGLRDTLEAFDDRCDSFVALKEGRQLLVYPFSDTLESPRRIDNIDEISKSAIEAFRKHVGGTYQHGQSSHLIDLRAGFIEDWAKVHLGVEKSFAFYLGPAAKDRRELKSQHLMDHMNGTLQLLKVIAAGRISEKSSGSFSSRISLALVYVMLNVSFFSLDR